MRDKAPVQDTVVIIGAGCAGIAAARVFHEHGVHAILVEAKSCIGGRVCAGRPFTPNLTAAPDERRVVDDIDHREHASVLPAHLDLGESLKAFSAIDRALPVQIGDILTIRVDGYPAQAQGSLIGSVGCRVSRGFANQRGLDRVSATPR